MICVVRRGSPSAESGWLAEMALYRQSVSFMCSMRGQERGSPRTGHLGKGFLHINLSVSLRWSTVPIGAGSEAV